MDLQLANKHFVISGISKGIGRSVAFEIMQEGGFAHGISRNEDDLKKFGMECESLFARTQYLSSADIRDRASLKESLDYIGDLSGGIHGIVHCAGFGSRGRILDFSIKDWEEQFQVKVLGLLNMLEFSLPWFKEDSIGKVVILNGITANKPEFEMAAVSACRASVSNLAKSLAHDLAPKATVNVINLGPIITSRQLDQWKRSGSKIPFEDWLSWETKRRGVLLNRFGRPEEVAALAAYLLSPLSNYMTGSFISFDGGISVS
ncbi:3-oxoacyl-[acyl-carrier-protein] reductase FabG [Corynebacterium freiburgense]|nr:3-oxoacyl-[acyl-carrier-protein] reductase FabG [Corynebacterium freiburgense]